MTIYDEYDDIYDIGYSNGYTKGYADGLNSRSSEKDECEWHNLLANAKDLPKDMDNVLVCYIGGDNNWYETMFYDASRQVFSLYGGTEFAKTRTIAKNETDFGSVIGWCYIYPFDSPV